jgi:hypothetical protein
MISRQEKKRIITERQLGEVEETEGEERKERKTLRREARNQKKNESAESKWHSKGFFDIKKIKKNLNYHCPPKQPPQPPPPDMP